MSVTTLAQLGKLLGFHKEPRKLNDTLQRLFVVLGEADHCGVADLDLELGKYRIRVHVEVDG